MRIMRMSSGSLIMLVREGCIDRADVAHGVGSINSFRPFCASASIEHPIIESVMGGLGDTPLLPMHLTPDHSAAWRREL
jgi:hypothetical protein